MGGNEDDSDALYPLKDVLEAVKHEDVVRHTEAFAENISQVGLSDVASLAAKAPDVIDTIRSKGLSGGLFGALKDKFNAVAAEAQERVKDAAAKGIDPGAEMEEEHEEL